MNSTVTGAAALLLSIFLVAGCSQTPLEQYREAVDSLKAARQTVVDQKAEVAHLRERLADLQKQLAEAVAVLEDNRKAMQRARRIAGERAGDQVLFHVIQNKLLHDDRFSQAVITVAVDNGRVTLTGAVPDKATRKAARKLAASQPGVAAVELKLDVRSTADG